MPEYPENLDTKSLNITEDKLQQLKQVVPEAFTEDGQVDFDKLKTTLGEHGDEQEERFGLQWAGKRDCFKVIQEPAKGTLQPAPEESEDWDNTENLLIEGDNLEVLKLLQKSYYGKVKMIYIDPPYNTGNEFIYPDDYKENLNTYLAYTGQLDEEGYKFSTNTETEGRYHSNWLNMMYPRLFMARNLLKDDGVIFISIDDHEVDNLKKICSEIFGEENLLGQIVWQHSIQPKGYLGKFSVHHNYILVYQKYPEFELKALPRSEEHNKHYSNPDNDPNGPWRTGDVRNSLYRPNLMYNLKTPSGKIIKPPKNGWRWSKDTMYSKINSGEILFNSDETKITRKIHLKNVEGRAPESIWFGKEVGTTREAAEELKDLFKGYVYFDTSKPIELIERILNLSTNSSGQDIILDFFAGSCSSAQSVMHLNKKDKGNRKYIMVQLPEITQVDSDAFKGGYKNMADIGKERIRRAAQKLKEGPKNNGQEQQSQLFEEEPSENQTNVDNLDLGFRVFKLDQSNFTEWKGEDAAQPVEQQLQLNIDHVRASSTEEQLLYEILLKSGYPLTIPIATIELAGKTVYSLGANVMLICLNKALDEAVIVAMAEKKPDKVVVLDKGFNGNDELKTNAVQSMKSHGVEDFRTV